MKALTKARLAIFLSKVGGFEKPKEGLEQYTTDSEIAAEVLWQAYLGGKIEGASAIDLGCGTGILGIGCLALGAKHVTFVDIDPEALEQAKAEVFKAKSEFFPKGEASFILGEAGSLASEGKLPGVEVVVMNPPFGTRKRGHDAVFLDAAAKIASRIVSFHKSESLAFLERFCSSRNLKLINARHFAFPLKATRTHHRRRIHRISVVVVEMEKQQGF